MHITATQIWILGLLFLGACSASVETVEQPRKDQQQTPHFGPVDNIQTVQLYAEHESALPILIMGSGWPLTLEFDLMEHTGRPLSVYFIHADRSWQPDLTPGEALTSFHRDDLFDYRISRNTQVPYTHYTYTFPNRSIDFRISGNYILRVTEQGREDDVLFERPFFVAENAAPTKFGLESLLVGNRSFRSIQPILTFTPPSSLTGNVFDYNVCFVRNGDYTRSRCSNKPLLTQQPDLLFYLEPEDSFVPREGDYYIDLSNLTVGLRVEYTDRTVSPFEVLLSRDYARFPSSGVEPLLNGQPVISSADTYVGDADLEAEYANVVFRYVPPKETPLPGGVYVVGSFNGWGVDLANALTWRAQDKVYEGVVLMKQGRHEYRYTSPDPEVKRQLEARLPRPDNLYTAFVYFFDVLLGTDRLLAFQQVVSR